MITIKYYLISYDTSYFSREQFISDAESEYQGELETITLESGYDSVEEAVEHADTDDLIYEVRWQGGEVLDYDILEERRF